ncbi:hypothetical protein [Rhodophyticola sp.]|uniref:hypothetical protein n=1 Tax=Rhodophyticola sp. TaxID=2680032 RepID=UPI003D28D1DF
MPATPELWLSEFTVNIGNLTGNQREQQITQLSNGNILVAWEDDTNNVDLSSGTDIIGQIYNPLGVAVGAPFRMNFYAQWRQRRRIRKSRQCPMAVGCSSTRTTTEQAPMPL